MPLDRPVGNWGGWERGGVCVCEGTVMCRETWGGLVDLPARRMLLYASRQLIS